MPNPTRVAPGWPTLRHLFPAPRWDLTWIAAFNPLFSQRVISPTCSHPDKVTCPPKGVANGLDATRGRVRFRGMNALSNWPRNRLLLALPSRNLNRLMPELEHIRCQRAEVLMDADSSLDHVFFPDDGVVSVVAVYANGSVIEMATIGREGCTAIQAFCGAKTSSVRLLVQIPGSAAKMSRAAFIRAMESMPSFRNLMSAYVHAFLEQVLVSVACNGAHSLKQRLTRWLLMMRDRSDGDAL